MLAISVVPTDVPSFCVKIPYLAMFLLHERMLNLTLFIMNFTAC